MRYFASEGVQPATALEALREGFNNSDLTKLVSSLVGPRPPTRKDDLVAALMRLLDGDHLAELWARLTPREQAMAAQTAWSKSGKFDRDRFDAVHETVSPIGIATDEEDEEGDEEDADDKPFTVGFDVGSGGGKRKRSALELIMPQGVMPRDIQSRLRQFVPKPKPPGVNAAESVPDSIDMPEHVWNSQTKSFDSSTKAEPVVRRETERAALHDLLAVLRLIDAGKVSVTDKNHWPTPAAIRQVAAILEGGDYYPDEELPKKKKKDEYENERPGPIRAFAWPMLVQAGKLAHARGSRLELTKDGRAALTAPPHETLRELWGAWLGTDLLDELRRINVIRGQTGNGRRDLTDPAERRDAIEEALAKCQVGQWIALDEFSRYMRAAGHVFEVTSDAWSLYIAEQQYGSLGYQGSGDWNILQFRYLLCLLMEYAATLGVIDVAFIPPDGARPDYSGMWGTDDLAFFSRYDGLLFMRVTGLGAYVMGPEGSYTLPPQETRKVITVHPNLDVIASGSLTSADTLLLDSFAEKTGTGVWRLDPARILDATASGREIQELTEFLKFASGAELPEPVNEFFTEMASRASALQDLGPARIIGCVELALAAFIANDPTAGRLCTVTDNDKLVVAAKDEAAFIRAIRKLGFPLRKSSR